MVKNPGMNEKSRSFPKSNQMVPGPQLTFQKISSKSIKSIHNIFRYFANTCRQTHRHTGTKLQKRRSLRLHYLSAKVTIPSLNQHTGSVSICMIYSVSQTVNSGVNVFQTLGGIQLSSFSPPLLSLHLPLQPSLPSAPFPSLRSRPPYCG